MTSIGNVYIADYYNHRIRKVTVATGIISTIAGTGSQGYGGDNGPATSAKLNLPYGVALDASGIFYIEYYYDYDLSHFLSKKETCTSLMLITNVSAR